MVESSLNVVIGVSISADLGAKNVHHVFHIDSQTRHFRKKVAVLAVLYRTF